MSSARRYDERPPQPTVTRVARVSGIRELIALPGGAELRALEPGDGRELQALIEANRAHLAEWLPWAAGQTRDDTERFIAWSREQLRNASGCQAAIVDRGVIVGVIGSHGIDRQHSSTRLGYWLAADAQGRGTMTQAVRAMLDEALDAWGLHRVEIRATVENERSRALIARVGFTFEGVAREAFRLGGAFRDDAVYSMLAPDWGVLRKARDGAHG
jgi:ribosomal-protein-serine acetyltransferase